MSDVFLPGVGAILSADIAVPEHGRELAFYTRVLGTGENPLWRPDLMNRDGIPVIGLGERTPEHADLPLQWMPHIQVADVAESVERALELGGRELMHGKDADGGSQWAVLLDPNRAAFGIIPVVPAETIPEASGDGAGGVSNGAEPRAGRIAWADLTVPDAPATRDFYRDVVGWTPQDVGMEDADGRYADYNMLGPDGSPLAGVCHARGTNLGLPPVWMIYLPVGDIAESLRCVEEEGGTVLKASRRADGGYAYGIIRDPVGASLALVPG